MGSYVVHKVEIPDPKFDMIGTMIIYNVIQSTLSSHSYNCIMMPSLERSTHFHSINSYCRRYSEPGWHIAHFPAGKHCTPSLAG